MAGLAAAADDELLALDVDILIPAVALSAAGTALVRAAGGRVVLADGTDPPFNQERPLHPNLLAAGVGTTHALLADWLGGLS